MSDVIFLKGLVMHAYHGVMRHENRVGQRFVVRFSNCSSI